MRLRDLGIGVGRLSPGPNNDINDVNGVRTGYVDVDEAGLATGITVLTPYQSRPRRVFIGRYALDGGDGMSGLGVTEDFGAISTPIVLAPAAAVGAVYDAVISRGLGNDSGLGEDAGWPPVVVGVDDSWLNRPEVVHRTVGGRHADAALSRATSGPTVEGSHGIGRGLAAFGVRGGVGTSSRSCALDGGNTHSVGALVAANGGEAARLNIDGVPVGAGLPIEPLPTDVPRTVTAVVATDAPLIPKQLDHLAGRAAMGLARVGILDGQTWEGLVLAVSTTGLGEAPDGSAALANGTVPAAMTSQAYLPPLYAAAMEACEEAVLNAMLQAEPLKGGDRRPGAGLGVLPQTVWPEEVRHLRHSRKG